MRILQPLLQRRVSRQFAGYHRLLKGNLESD
jgi:hypothetical protein